MRLYVGNIPFKSTVDELRQEFARFGVVERVDIVMDRETQRPRGFAFVDMDDHGGDEAIEQLNGVEFGGRRLTVNQAKERASRPRPARDNWT